MADLALRLNGRNVSWTSGAEQITSQPIHRHETIAAVLADNDLDKLVNSIQSSIKFGSEVEIPTCHEF